MEVVIARSFRARLLGLALRRAPPRHALLIPRCRCVHTFGMRFALDLVWLDADGQVLAVDRRVGPGRVVARRGAWAVLEAPASLDIVAAVAEPGAGNRFLQALNPRVPIYRDTYNEYFVMVLSAGGAAAGTQVPLYILMAITGLWSVGVFVAACVVFELAVIFGVARPQMKPQERAGWAALWGFATAALALCFYYLVADPTL
ncbi:MAG TPA: DUF192 domain-containing protein [Thermoleophilaceae bacterium]|nr:DUF192 domain-containing protein [Thermoleophilaceae bacterium]